MRDLCDFARSSARLDSFLIKSALAQCTCVYCRIITKLALGNLDVILPTLCRLNLKTLLA